MEDYKEKEKAYRDAFKFFDKDGDGKISTAELDMALSALGNKLTRIEMERLLFCLDPEAITEQDFLNVMASALIHPFHRNPTVVKLRNLLYDAFQLYNAAKHKKTSDTAAGKLSVHDNNLIMREDFERFTNGAFMKRLNVKSKGAVDTAFIAPYVHFEIPVSAEDFFEVHRVDYDAWLNKVKKLNEKMKYWVYIKTTDAVKSEMIEGLRIYNVVYGRKEGKPTMDGLRVKDDNQISTADLEKIMLQMGDPLSKEECADFMAKAKDFATDPDGKYVNYNLLCNSLA